MSESQSIYVPFVKSIFHPSDFSEESGQAFAHALTIAFIRKTELTILYVEKKWKSCNEITAAANECNVDLIAMTTQGHKEIFEAIRGSVTEQVLSQAPCPVLAVTINRVSETAGGEKE